MNNKYNIQYFISKFEAIPEDKWLRGSLGANGVHCASGHCGVNSNNLISDNLPLEAKELANILRRKIFEQIGEYIPRNDYELIYNINDGWFRGLDLKHPKQNILNTLKEIKARDEKLQMYTKDATTELLSLPISPDKADVKVKELIEAN